MNSEDFEIHNQKKSHKEKEAKLKSTRQSPIENDVVAPVQSIGANDIQYAIQSDQLVELKTVSSINSVNSNVTQANSDEMVVSSTSVVQLKDVIQIDKVLQAMATEMIDFASRTQIRVQNEADIMNKIVPYLKEVDITLKTMKFGSSRYGFGGLKTNLNVLVNAGKIIQRNFAKY